MQITYKNFRINFAYKSQNIPSQLSRTQVPHSLLSGGWVAVLSEGQAACMLIVAGQEPLRPKHFVPNQTVLFRTTEYFNKSSIKNFHSIKSCLKLERCYQQI